MKKLRIIMLAVCIACFIMVLIEGVMLLNQRSTNHGKTTPPPIATTIDGTPLSNTPDNPAGEWEGPKD